MTKLKKKILVVCHDAGGAEIVSAWVKKHAGAFETLALVSGPARRIFTRKGLSPFLSKRAAFKLMDRMDSRDLVLTGTSGEADLERRCIRKAKEKGIQTVSYLDHWVHYRERFSYPEKGWETNLPHELWVGDRRALALARRLFRHVPVRFVQNEYWREVKARYKVLARRIRPRAGTVLFMSEPGHGAFDEHKILKSVLDFLSRSPQKRSLIIAHHPSESKQKYHKLLARYRHKIRFVREHGTRVRDFACSDIVIGMRSMGLVLAALLRKKTVSILPASVPFPLPVRGIVRVHDATGLCPLPFFKHYAQKR